MSLNRIQMYKRKVASKYNFIVEELEKTSGILEKTKLVIEEKVSAFLKAEDEALPSQFSQIDKDLELFHDKLCIIQEELENLENGKQSIQNDSASSLAGMKQGILAVTQNGTAVGLNIDGDTEQLKVASPLSNQNDEIPCGRNTFHEQMIRRCYSESEEKINTKLSAYDAEQNVVSGFCNEAALPTNTGLSSDIYSSQNNVIKSNTQHDAKEINTEKSKIPQIVKSNFVMEQVSSSDGSSVYGTVSSVCSEVHMMDKSETSEANDAVKLVHESASPSKQSIHNSHLCTPFKQSRDKNIVRTQSVGDSSSESVPYPDLEIGSSVSAAVPDITSPSDFWIQIDSECTKQLCPVEDLVAFYDGLSDIKRNMYCLAPFKEQRGYFRAKILELSETVPGKQRVRVLYIDLGCRGSLNASSLKVLPSSLQKIPCTAVHCVLYGVIPVNGVWSHEAITKFKEIIDVSRFKISICSRVDDIYFVKISVITCIPGNDEFIYDMSECMSTFKYGIMENDAIDIQHSVAASSVTCASVTSHKSQAAPKLSHQSSLINEPSSQNNEVTSMTLGNEFPDDNNSYSQDMPTDGFNHEVHRSRKSDHTFLCGSKEERKPVGDDLGNERKIAVGFVSAENVQVSATNISNFQKNGTEKDLSTNSVSEPVSFLNNTESHKSMVGKFVSESAQVHEISISNNENGAKNILSENTKSGSLVNSKLDPLGRKSSPSCSVLSSTDSCNLDQNVKVPVNNLPYVTANSSNINCISSQRSCSDFDWNIKIPLPSQKFTKKAKFIVMLSAVVSPSDFYVNLAMPTSNELDELQEHMLCEYQNFDTSAVVLPPVNKLCGMFCCCQFKEDKNWYRVQVLELCNPMADAQNSATHVRIQYVDYGDEDEVNISELLPLKKEFATHPPFSFHCALAGIKPKLTESSCDNSDSSKWDEEAIIRFKSLASFDKCYTAEIAYSVIYDARKTPIPVYLWDNISTKDILINIILVEQGAADGSDLELLNCPTEGNVQDMDLWDPMAADFNSTLNSYGVNLNDPEIATVGYKANDEAYVCKFFAATGKCHRGDKCYYQHIFISGDSTLDQEPVEYLGEAVTLPDIESTAFVMVSAMFNPGHFFVVFPFGTKSLESIYSEIQRYVHEEKDCISEFMDNMNKHYNKNHCRKENTAVAAAIGDLVAVKWKDNLWYRGRVCDVFDIAAPLVVHFVDYGNCEHVERVGVYELEPQFRHFPFQAVECHLYGVEAKVSDESQWSSESRIKFQELTEGKVLVAHIKTICGSSLYVELFSCIKDQEFSINSYLVQNGYGKFVKQDSGNNSSSQLNSQKANCNNTVIFTPA